MTEETNNDEYMEALDKAIEANRKYVDYDDAFCRMFRAGYEAGQRSKQCELLKQNEDFREALEEQVKECAGFEYETINYWKDELLVRAWKRAREVLAKYSEEK